MNLQQDTTCLGGMQWFWNQACPCRKDRGQITVSLSSGVHPGTAEGLAAMILNGEDVLRDEARHMPGSCREAGVDVTALWFQAIIHDLSCSIPWMDKEPAGRPWMCPHE